MVVLFLLMAVMPVLVCLMLRMIFSWVPAPQGAQQTCLFSKGDDYCCPTPATTVNSLFISIENEQGKRMN